MLNLKEEGSRESTYDPSQMVATTVQTKKKTIPGQPGIVEKSSFRKLTVTLLFGYYNDIEPIIQLTDKIFFHRNSI